MNNKRHTVQTLLHNQSFRRVVKGTASGDEIEKWNRWVEKSEQNRAVAKKAMSEIAGFTFSDPQDVDIDREWSRLKRETIDKREYPLREERYSNSHSSLSWISKIAAVLILGVLTGYGAYMYAPTADSDVHLEQITEERTVSTISGEEKNITFSNGSRIILNSNSTVTYSIDKHQGKTIDVLIEGEAFFDAEGGQNKQQPVFSVQTPDGVIRDIGTEFLVTVEEDLSRVVLQEGKVQVYTNDQKDPEEYISVVDGEMLEFNKHEVLTKKKVNSTFYTSWATGSMEFDQTSVKEFAGFLEQRFDIQVEITDPDLANIKIDGGIYYQSLEELVRSVSEVANVPVYQSEDRQVVYIGNKN